MPIRVRVALLFCLGGAAIAGHAAPPPVNLRIELRVIDENAVPDAAGNGAYSVGTRRERTESAGLQLDVLNGESGTLRLRRALPLQWVQAAGTTAAASGAAGAKPGGIVNGLTWVRAGQGLWLQPQWPGGESPVRLQIRYEGTQLDEAASGALPGTQEHSAGTTLKLAPGRWTTFAATGTPTSPPQAGEWSTIALGKRGRQLMQVRVTAP